MKYKQSISLLLLGLASAGISSTTMAEGNIDLQHSVIASDTNSVNLSIIIDNSTTEDLYGVTLTPKGTEFSAKETPSEISIGDVSAGGQLTVEWTANTALSASYFQSGLPVFFNLHATNISGENVEYTVYSLGGAQ